MSDMRVPPERCVGQPPRRPVAATEPEWRLFAALVGARRILAPDGSRRGQLVHALLRRAVDALDWAYVRATPAPVSNGTVVEHDLVQAMAAPDLRGPLVKIDGPAPGAHARTMTLLWGWALDRASASDAGVSAVRVYVDGVWQGTATYGIDRHDVAQQFGHNVKRCGWQFALDLRNASPGPHTVQIAAYGSASGQETTCSHPLVVEASLAPPTAVRCALFVSGCPGDPLRYRCDHQAQQLHLLGMTADVAVYGEVALGDVVDRYQVFVLHRVLFSPDVAWFIDTARRRGRVVLYDTDDLVFDLAATPFMAAVDDVPNGEREKFMDCLVRGRQALVRCDAVLVSTQPLRELAGRIHPRVVVSPNVVDRNMVDQATAVLRGGAGATWPHGARIAYLSGTPTHDRDFQEIADDLVWALDAYPLTRLVIVGPLRLDARFERFRERVVKLPLRPWGQLPELIGDVDINLAPLEADNPFTAAKSCIKYLEAALVGVPTIASRCPDFARVITDGVSGFLASGSEEWRSALTHLIESPQLRDEIGQRARADVLRHHTAAAAAPLLLNTLRELIGVAAGDEPLTINWVVRGPDDDDLRSLPLSRPVAELAGYLAGRGHRICISVPPRIGGRDLDPAEVMAQIQRSCGPVAIDTVVGQSVLQAADVTIATDPSTAHMVAPLGASPLRAYFIQDHPTGLSPRAVPQPFLLPLRRICFGGSIARAVGEFSGAPVAQVDRPADDDDKAGWTACGTQLERILLQLAFVGRVPRTPTAPEPRPLIHS